MTEETASRWERRRLCESLGLPAHSTYGELAKAVHELKRQNTELRSRRGLAALADRLLSRVSRESWRSRALRAELSEAWLLLNIQDAVDAAPEKCRVDGDARQTMLNFLFWSGG